jgi:single-stranded DNA-binding protein
MAEIKFTGFVDPWSSSNEQHPDWGMKVVEPHRRKNDTTDEWETVGRTWRTVKAAYEITIDFTQFKKGDRVTVVGREITETREVDGKKYYTLTVKAESVIVESAGQSSAAPVAASSDWGTPAVSVEAPF